MRKPSRIPRNLRLMPPPIFGRLTCSNCGQSVGVFDGVVWRDMKSIRRDIYCRVCVEEGFRDEPALLEAMRHD